MPVFEYTARDAKGGRVVGEVTGATVEAVVADLERKNLAPISIAEQKARSGLAALLGVGSNSTSAASPGDGVTVRVSVRALATFYRQLSDLLRSGVPILRSLQLLSRSKSNARLASVVGAIALEVADGESLADSMEKHGQTFPRVHIAMVRAGERGGFLEEVLHRLSIFLGKQADLRSNVIGTLIYPAVLVTLGTVLIGVVMVVFVPKFRAMLAGLDIPLPTKMVLWMSDMLSNHLLFVIASVVGVLILVMYLRSQPDVRRWVSAVATKTPIVGTLVRSMSVARFARMLGTLLTNGIPMLQAMAISREAAGNALMMDAIEEATSAVEAGESLADPLERSGLFEEETVEIIRIGEQANNLDDVLLSIAETIEGRVDRMLTTAVRLLEPLLLVVLGLIMLFIILALVVPLVLLSASI